MGRGIEIWVTGSGPTVEGVFEQRIVGEGFEVTYAGREDLWWEIWWVGKGYSNSEHQRHGKEIGDEDNGGDV